MLQRLIAPLLASLMLAAAPASVQAQDKVPSPRIQISGVGEVHAAPDMAIVDLTVLREAETARQALSANNAAMREVLDAMKEAGIAERDLQTSGISIRPRYRHPGKDNNLKEPKIIGYSVTNSLTVRVRDLKAAGTVLDKSVTLGVNEGGNLRFVNDDTTSIMREARKRAVTDALDKAKTLAEAAGVKVGRIIEMSEQTNRPRPVAFARQAALAAAPAAESVPLATGENTYRVTVEMVLAIEQ
ncbi:MAG: SIMPL domain-containing protein [Xanthobacteraceae bacterium]